MGQQYKRILSSASKSNMHHVREKRRLLENGPSEGIVSNCFPLHARYDLGYQSRPHGIVECYNPGQNVLGHLRKLGTKTHFAKLTHILPLKKAWGCCYKGLFLLSPSPPSSIDYVELKLECITSTLHRGVRGEGRCLNLTSYCVSVPRVWTRAVVWLMTLMFEGPTSSSWTWAEMR